MIFLFYRLNNIRATLSSVNQSVDGSELNCEMRVVLFYKVCVCTDPRLFEPSIIQTLDCLNPRLSKPSIIRTLDNPNYQVNDVRDVHQIELSSPLIENILLHLSNYSVIRMT